MSRAAETLASIPFATRVIMGVCIFTYAYQLLFDPPLQNFTMCPSNVLYRHEYYRFVSSSLFHASLMHIGMNMMSTMAIGGSLEKKVGTLLLGLTILYGTILTSAVYVLVSWLLWLLFGYKKLMLQHSVGFSGVIFQLSVLESNLSPDRVRSVFGMFQVSSKMYPWVLLVVLQFIMPQISFLGHLSGILVGTLQYYGMLDKLFPSETYLQDCEISERLAFLRRQVGYCETPETSELRNRDASPGALGSAAVAAFGGFIVFIQNVCETIRVCIFGRGAEANENIQLSAPWASSDIDPAPASGGGALQELEDDDEWVGLPEVIQRSTEEV